ncbi:MAG: helix-turn-helix domain-containing protein [Thermoproteota archaeon]|nr:helix-turn-helix domain-containing protein [Thermoproteota archaeon]
METLTIAEAAEATGLTKKAIRNRVDRGQLRAVLRDGVRRIPRSELDRAGLDADSLEAGDGADIRQGAASRQPKETSAWAELLDRLERQAGELAELRVLTREAESLREDRERLEGAFHEARARASELEAKLDVERQATAKQLEQVASARWWERRRLLRELRDRRTL